jgi:MoxR-like ATPase
VLREDYSTANFVPGPLVEAMQAGGFLYIEEFNRAPEDTLNTLLTAMADRKITVPRVGVVTARPSFRVVASMNPLDDVGTTRLSTSVHDRMCRLAVGYQDTAAEEVITGLRTGPRTAALEPGLRNQLIADAVAVTRATRVHPDVRQGSSVRGAIDCVLVAAGLARLRGVSAGQDEGYGAVLLDAVIVALSGRIHLDDAAQVTPEQILRAIWEEHLVLQAAAAPG